MTAPESCLCFSVLLSVPLTRIRNTIAQMHFDRNARESMPMSGRQMDATQYANKPPNTNHRKDQEKQMNEDPCEPELHKGEVCVSVLANG